MHLVDDRSTDKLVELVGANKRAAIVMNAADAFGDENRPAYFRKYADSLEALEFQPEELDLRRYLNKPDAPEAVVRSVGLLWVTGGNTFTLQRAFRNSELEHFLKTFLTETELV